MKITTNFSLEEFESKDGAEMPLEVLENITVLCENLQVLREKIDRPITVTSGYRSPSHNKKIGGAKNSFHVRGMAADIKAEGLTPKELIDVIEELIEEGLMVPGGIGKYSSWVHYDTRGYNAKW
jgi:uncharacterized protein YcbK (DUF882 family)